LANTLLALRASDRCHVGTLPHLRVAQRALNLRLALRVPLADNIVLCLLLRCGQLATKLPCGWARALLRRRSGPLKVSSLSHCAPSQTPNRRAWPTPTATWRPFASGCQPRAPWGSPRPRPRCWPGGALPSGFLRQATSVWGGRRSRGGAAQLAGVLRLDIDSGRRVPGPRRRRALHLASARLGCSVAGGGHPLRAPVLVSCCQVHMNSHSEAGPFAHSPVPDSLTRHPLQ
jgi:hypothetical protein